MEPPVIDYTDKDYASLRRALLEQARYRLPEWTDQSPNDLGVLLVDLFAYLGDVILYYQDRIANESFLSTAVERQSVMHHLRLVGYELGPPVAASADLDLTFDAPEPGDPTVVTVPHGSTFAATATDGTPLTFAYLGSDLSVDLDPAAGQVTAPEEGQRRYAGLPVRHSRLVSDEVLGSSTGEPNQQFALAQAPLILETLVLSVFEGGVWTPWTRRDTFVYALDPLGRLLLGDPEERVYTVQYDAAGAASVVFGDGVYGRRPPIGPNNVRATYRVGGGALGNVPAGTIAEAETAIDLLAEVTNPLPAAGGADAETAEHAVRFGPLAFRSGLRAVTVRDFEALAHAAGGVAKVRARSAGPHRVDLYVAPEGTTCRPLPDDLRTRLTAYFEDKRMAGTVVHLHDAVCVPVDVSLDVIAAYHYDAEAVRRDVERAVADLLAFDAVEFAMPLYLSKVYERVEALEGVFAATVTRFRRAEDDGTDEALAALLDAFGVTTTEELPEAVRATLGVAVPAGGLLAFDAFEIPSLGALQVRITETASAA